MVMQDNLKLDVELVEVVPASGGARQWFEVSSWCGVLSRNRIALDADNTIRDVELKPVAGELLHVLQKALAGYMAVSSRKGE